MAWGDPARDHDLVLSVGSGGELRLNGRQVRWPDIPAVVARSFQSSTSRTLLVCADPAFSGAALADGLARLRRYVLAASATAPSGYGQARVVLIRQPAATAPREVTVGSWFVSRFLTPR